MCKEQREAHYLMKSKESPRENVPKMVAEIIGEREKKQASTCLKISFLPASLGRWFFCGKSFIKEPLTKKRGISKRSVNHRVALAGIYSKKDKIR